MRIAGEFRAIRFKWATAMPSDDGHSASISTLHDESASPKPADRGTPSLVSGSRIDADHAAGELGRNLWKRDAGWSPRLRLLCVGPQEPSWVSLTLQLDADGCFEPKFRWVNTSHEALTVLRDEHFDCIVLSMPGLSGFRKTVGHRPGLSPAGPVPGGSESASFEPVSLVRAIRASGHDDPIVVLASRLNDESWAELCHNNCEVLTTPNLWESLALVPVIKRAIRHVELAREKHHLAVAQQRRLVRDRDEAEHLLKQQWQIISDLRQGTSPASDDYGEDDPSPPNSDDFGGPSPSRFGLPPEINDYYHELLRTYVIMGTGSLGTEIAKLAELIALAGLSPRESLELHLERVESLVKGLGRRSARHVMARADLLALELVLHLGEWYQKASENSRG